MRNFIPSIPPIQPYTLFCCVVRRDYVVESHLGGKKSSCCSRECECHCSLLLLVLALLFLLLWGSRLVVLKTEGIRYSLFHLQQLVFGKVSPPSLSAVLVVSLGMNFLLMLAYARSGLAPYLKLKKQGGWRPASETRPPHPHWLAG
jgi:hypothetical protein